MRYAVTLPNGTVRTRTSDEEPLTHAVVIAVTAAEQAAKKNSGQVDIEDYPEDEVVQFHIYSWAASREQAYKSKDRARGTYQNVRILTAAEVGSDPTTIISSGVEVALAAYTEI